MEQGFITCAGCNIPVYAPEALVIGSGCAGFNAADWLYDLGCRDTVLITEGMKAGTSRNTGSDKQTYYKLSLAFGEPDSVEAMAGTLFAGGGVNGDTALSEAAGSVRCFMKLVNLGVPFPSNEYGEFAGYQTDHDQTRRATSAGPLTSRYMTEALEQSVRRKGIRIFDRMMAVRLLVRGGEIFGVLALDLSRDGAEGLTLFACRRVILATGGPAGIYEASVYPCGHRGMTGMALEAGARAVNLQEWQYGLASTSFRWNVSGSYQQVLPRYVSVDREGREREFLPDYFASPREALHAVFLKGYQWPFDVRKAGGSSRIDLIVHREAVELGRRVYLDFSRDPAGIGRDFSGLPEEARRYLEQSRALKETPIARLQCMNPDAVALYRAHGIDLEKEMLPVAVCAQHNNGGLWVDKNWQTSIGGLYAAGECAGTFGVYRPGGSALNSGQVGSMRAAEHIAARPRSGALDVRCFESQVRQTMEGWLGGVLACLGRRDPGSTSEQIRKTMQRRMSAEAAHIRDPQALARFGEELEETLDAFFQTYRPKNSRGLAQMLATRDILLTQRAVLSAMEFAAAAWGSRGSALVTGGGGEEGFCGNGGEGEQIPGREYQVITERKAGGFLSFETPVRPLPQRDPWFENVWRAYKERKAGQSAPCK